MSQLYRPATGTEGADFMERWCFRCAKDKFTDEHPENGCPIIVASYCGFVEQWVVFDGRAMCTDFEGES
jgi:hypothetical protein